MLRDVYLLATLVMAPMLFGFVLGDRFVDVNEEPIFDADNLLLHLHTEKRLLSVQLEEHALPNAPVFVLREDGSYDQDQPTNDEPTVRFFKTSQGHGNFILREDELGSQMSGFVVDGLERVVLKPAMAEERRRRDAGNWHVISRRQEQKNEQPDREFFPSGDVMKNYTDAMNKTLVPKVRGGNIQQTIGLVAFIDSEIIAQRIRALGTSDKDKITQDTKLYFTQIVASMDDRYRLSFQNDPDLRLSIVPVGFVISMTSGGSPWTEGAKVQISGKPVDEDGRKTAWGDLGLDVFREWIVANSVPVKYDYALYFTGRNIATTDDGSFSVIGIAPVGGICSAYATGASEDFGAFDSAGVASHELGHNLGSRHDGATSNADAAKCKDADNYLMAPSIRDDVNQLVFSPCSKIQIKKLLAARTCLQDPVTRDPFAASVADKFIPGKLYTIQDRCKALNGPQALPIKYDNLISNKINICLDLACYPKAGNGYTWQPAVAPTGTPCGDGKWCVAGRCVDDPAAPKGSCFMGDVAVSDGSVATSCANALPKLLKTYGKKTSSELCSVSADYKKNCCRTCNVPGGFDASSGSIPVIPTPPTVSITTGKGPATTPRTTTTTTTPSWSCADGPQAQGSCPEWVDYCDYTIELNGVDLGNVADVCPYTCGAC